MRAFNAWQLVTLFAAGPGIVYWLSTEPFPWASVMQWVGVVGYVVLYAWMCFITYEGLGSD